MEMFKKRKGFQRPSIREYNKVINSNELETDKDWDEEEEEVSYVEGKVECKRQDFGSLFRRSNTLKIFQSKEKVKPRQTMTKSGSLRWLTSEFSLKEPVSKGVTTATKWMPTGSLAERRKPSEVETPRFTTYYLDEYYLPKDFSSQESLLNRQIETIVDKRCRLEIPEIINKTLETMREYEEEFKRKPLFIKVNNGTVKLNNSFLRP